MYVSAPTLDAIPTIRHGFFLRGNHGSQGIYRGLNSGFGSADAPEVVRANRARAMAALSVPAERLATPHQVHSARAVIAERPEDIVGRRLDAVVTSTPGLPVAVLTADCAPLLFAEPDAGVVAAAHAGWRGARFGVVSAAMRAMMSLGARRERIRVAIGPTIGAASYEVGSEFPQNFLSESAANARFFSRPRKAERAYFDLPGYIRAQLAQLGVESVTDMAMDTVTDAERFFSYRRSVLQGEPDYGRMLSAIVLSD